MCVCVCACIQNCLTNQFIETKVKLNTEVVAKLWKIQQLCADILRQFCCCNPLLLIKLDTYK